MKPIQNIKGEFEGKLITIIPGILYFSKTRVDQPDRIGHKVSVGITPFFSFTFTLGLAKPNPLAPPKIKKGDEIAFFDGVRTVRYQAAGPARATGWEVPLKGISLQHTEYLIWVPRNKTWTPKKSDTNENSP